MITGSKEKERKGEGSNAFTSEKRHAARSFPVNGVAVGSGMDFRIRATSENYESEVEWGGREKRTLSG